MAKTAAEKQKDYRARQRNSNAPVTERDANSNGNAPDPVTVTRLPDTAGTEPKQVSTVTHGQVTVRTGFSKPNCPGDWLDKTNSLPVGVVRPLLAVTAEIRHLTNSQLRSALPRTRWQASQAYAEVVYRLLYWDIEDIGFVPSWRQVA